MALKLITPPPVEPLSLEEVKAHLHVDFSDDDSIIQLYMVAARGAIEGPDGWTGRALVEQTWDLVIDTFPTTTDGEIKIPCPPLRSVTSVKYFDSAGNEQTLDPTSYYVDTVSEPGWIVPVSTWPATQIGTNMVTVRFVAGYEPDVGGSPVDYRVNIPGNIRGALLLIIGNLYENREENLVGTSVTELPWGVQNLLRPSRVLLGMA